MAILQSGQFWPPNKARKNDEVSRNSKRITEIHKIQIEWATLLLPWVFRKSKQRSSVHRVKMYFVSLGWYFGLSFIRCSEDEWP